MNFVKRIFNIKSKQNRIYKNICNLYLDGRFIERDLLKSFIETEIGDDPFILLMLVGPSQFGKSTYGNFLNKNKYTKSPFKVGQNNRSQTHGCQIVHAGTIRDIIKNTNCDKKKIDEDILKSNIHVFICDTEGIQSTTSDDNLASFILPLIDVSAKLIYFTRINPDNTKTKFLEMCQKISEIMGNNHGRSIFEDKLILRVRDWPQLVSKKKRDKGDDCDDDDDEFEGDIKNLVAQFDLEKSIEKCQESDMAQFLSGYNGDGHNRISLPIQFAPGGPTKPGEKLSKPYNDYLVQLLFTSIHQEFIFTKDSFIGIFFTLVEEYSKQKELISAYLQAFDFKEVDLKLHTDEICQQIIEYFNDLRNSRSLSLNSRETEARKNEYLTQYNDYLNELQFGDNKKIKDYRNLIELTFDNQKKTTEEIYGLRRELIDKQREARSITKRRNNVLNYLSGSIKILAKSAVDSFFNDFNKSTLKFSTKDEIRVNNNISNSKLSALRQLDENNNRNILGEEISTLVEDDIKQIYNYLSNWPSWLPYQNGNIFERFIGRTFYCNNNDLIEKNIQGHEGMRGLFKNEWHDGKCCRGIIIEDRNYKEKLQDRVIEISRDEAEKKLIENSSDNFINQLKQVVPSDHNLLDADPLQINTL